MTRSTSRLRIWMKDLNTLILVRISLMRHLKSTCPKGSAKKKMPPNIEHGNFARLYLSSSNLRTELHVSSKILMPSRVTKKELKISAPLQWQGMTRGRQLRGSSSLWMKADRSYSFSMVKATCIILPASSSMIFSLPKASSIEVQTCAERSSTRFGNCLAAQNLRR